MSELQEPMSNLLAALQLPETDWETKDKALNQVKLLIKNKDSLSWILKLNLMDKIILMMHSLRTQLSLTTCLLVTEMALCYKEKIDLFSDTLHQNLLKVASQTKKLAHQSANRAIKALIENSTFRERHLVIFCNALNEKNINTRQNAIFCILSYMNLAKSNIDARNAMRSVSAMEILENCLKKGIQDASGGVRDTTRLMYVDYVQLFSDRIDGFLDSLTASVRKAILIAPSKQPILKKPSPSPPPPLSSIQSSPLDLGESISLIQIPSTTAPKLRKSLSKPSLLVEQDQQMLKKRQSSPSLLQNSNSKRSFGRFNGSIIGSNNFSPMTLTNEMRQPQVSILDNLKSLIEEKREVGIQSLLDLFISTTTPNNKTRQTSRRSSISSSSPPLPNLPLSKPANFDTFGIVLADIVLKNLNISFFMNTDNANALKKLVQNGCLEESTIVIKLASLKSTKKNISKPNDDNSNNQQQPSSTTMISFFEQILKEITSTLDTSGIILMYLKSFIEFNMKLFSTSTERFPKPTATNLTREKEKRGQTHLTRLFVDAIKSMSTQPLFDFEVQNFLSFDDDGLVRQFLVKLIPLIATQESIVSSQFNKCDVDNEVFGFLGDLKFLGRVFYRQRRELFLKVGESLVGLEGVSAVLGELYGSVVVVCDGGDSGLLTEKNEEVCLDGNGSLNGGSSSFEFAVAEKNVFDETLPDGWFDENSIQQSSFSNSIVKELEVDQTPILNDVGEYFFTPSKKNLFFDNNEGERKSASMAGSPTPVKNSPLRDLSGNGVGDISPTTTGAQKLLERNGSLFAGGGYREIVEDELEMLEAEDKERYNNLYQNDSIVIEDSKTSQNQILETLLNDITTTGIDEDLMRRFLWISNATSGVVDGIWDVWFEYSYRIIKDVLRDSKSPLNEQEACMIILNSLIINQSVYFDDILEDLFDIVVECRSDGSEEISGASDRALKSILSTFDFQKLMQVILLTITKELNNEPNSRKKTVVGLSNVINDVKNMINGGSSKGSILVVDSTSKGENGQSNRDCFYQPSKCRSAFESLLDLMKSLERPNDNNSCEVEGNSVFNRITTVCKKGINSEFVDTRRGAVMTFVLMGNILGEELLWEKIEGELTTNQEKLVAVYIERGRRMLEESEYPNFASANTAA